MQSYGGILVHDGATAQNFSTTPSKLTAFAANGDQSSQLGGDLSIVPDMANDRVRVKPGIYDVSLHVSATAAVAQSFQFHLRADAVEQPIAFGLLGVAAAGTIRNGSCHGILDLTQETPDADGFVNVQVYGESDAGGGAAITVNHAQLVVKRVA